MPGDSGVGPSPYSGVVFVMSDVRLKLLGGLCLAMSLLVVGEQQVSAAVLKKGQGAPGRGQGVVVVRGDQVPGPDHRPAPPLTGKRNASSQEGFPPPAS